MALYVIVSLPTAHTAVLEDPLTGEDYHRGKPISVARLVRFHFPREWSGPHSSPEVDADRADLVARLRIGSFVAVQPTLPGMHQRVWSARSPPNGWRRSFFTAQQARAALALGDAGGGTCGWLPTGPPVASSYWKAKSCVRVFLQEQALTVESLERLASYGGDVGMQPHRDRSLPPRRMLE